jgi:hypothetical protein
MKEIGFVTVLILALCVATYLYRQPALTGTDPSTDTTYESAIKAARAAKGTADAEARRKWVLGLQLTLTQQADGPSYSAEGDNAETLVITSESADRSFCSDFAKSVNGSSAASIGFTEVICRNSSISSEYKMPLMPNH